MRYVGGSVIGRLLYRLGKQIDNRDLTESPSQLQTYSIYKFLSGDVSLLNDSLFPQSLSEIKDRLYGNLIILTDECYLFFVKLEEKRLHFLNEPSILTYGGKAAGITIGNIMSDEEVNEAWQHATNGKLGCNIHKPTYISTLIFSSYIMSYKYL